MVQWAYSSIITQCQGSKDRNSVLPLFLGAHPETSIARQIFSGDVVDRENAGAVKDEEPAGVPGMVTRKAFGLF